MADEEATEGASPYEQLLYASKNDSLELADSSLRNPKLGEDVNKADGLGYTGMLILTDLPIDIYSFVTSITALHYA